MRLELRNMAADARLGHSQAFGGSTDPAKPRNAIEADERGQAYRSKFLNHEFNHITLLRNLRKGYLSLIAVARGARAARGETTMNILITGASSGFGLLMAEDLIMEGHNVAATVRDPGGRNADAATLLAVLGVEVIDIDVTDESGRESRRR
jgi:hypothetical protein